MEPRQNYARHIMCKASGKGIIMNKRRVDISKCSNDINKALAVGAFLTTGSGDKVNSMVIGWGHVGIIWARPSYICYVRESRYTKELLDANPEFTINVPVNGFDKNAFNILGSKSGRDMDKIAETGLTLVDSDKISVPGIKEYPLTLECKVIYCQDQEPGLIDDAVMKQFYPAGDYHTMYIGEIVDAYYIED